MGVNDEMAILERMDALQCDGFIGFYATVATSSLLIRLETLKSSSQKGFDFKIYDHNEIEKLLDDLDVQQSSALIERYGIERKPNLKVASVFLWWWRTGPRFGRWVYSPQGFNKHHLVQRVQRYFYEVGTTETYSI